MTHKYLKMYSISLATGQIHIKNCDDISFYKHNNFFKRVKIPCMGEYIKLVEI